MTYMASGEHSYFSIDETGRSHLDSFESPKGVQLEVYEDRIYVRDKPERELVMQINHGCVVYRDVTVEAWFKKRRTLYALISVGHPTEKDFKAHACIATYSLERDDRIGVRPSEIKELHRILVDKTSDWHSNISAASAWAKMSEALEEFLWAN